MAHSGINLHSGDTMDANLTDLVTHASWSHPFAINIPTTVGGDTAYVDFTGATGGLTSTQRITAWTYLPGTP